EPRTLAFIQFIVQFSKVIIITACRGDLLILTNSEELVKDGIELFFQSSIPSSSAKAFALTTCLVYHIMSFCQELNFKSCKT
ncbi:hypothetical protein, partial [uncultured Megasphaera sp.]|uniref:hypothetical protein n=1 Tax=uncultured Megasphaera sp. TaxID=165188 RepID=UPI00266FE444